ncbi:MAG: hypothetical protein ACR2P6_10490, partial [Gammaproteobacteria bacterium]
SLTSEGEYMPTETQTGLTFEELGPERNETASHNDAQLNAMRGVMLGVGLGLLCWALLSALLIQ